MRPFTINPWETETEDIAEKSKIIVLGNLNYLLYQITKYYTIIECTNIS